MSLARPRKKRRYHHGDLPAALRQAATEILDEDGFGALTLREVARRLGVTHAAPYRHYADKDALVAAVASEGLRELGRALANEPRQEGHGAGELRAIVSGYIRFARQRPGLYRAIFGLGDAGRVAAARPSSVPQHEEARAALANIELAVRQAQADGVVRAGDPAVLALVVWVHCHGVASLSRSPLGGLLAPLGVELGDAAGEPRVDDVLVELLRGIAPRSHPPDA